MRTTIEIDEGKLRKLRELAARPGERGYSRLIDEALDAYLAEEGAGFDHRSDAAKEARIARLRALDGSIGEEEAEAWKARIRESRRQWRTR
jgi:hypothetical protein